MFPGFLLVTAGDLRVALIGSGALALFMGIVAQWVRVQYGDYKYPGRRTGRRVGERAPEESE